MIRGVFFLFLAIITGVFLFYLILPNPPFPQPPPDSPQSTERGDSEDLALRRAYFTDHTRAQVLEHYQTQWQNIYFGGIRVPVPVYRLNYPPEEAKVIIKEQTRSTFLEEIVHPFRESFFVNGFLPSHPKDTIIIDSRQFHQKITVKYVQSALPVRIVLALASSALLFLISRQLYKSFSK